MDQLLQDVRYGVRILRKAPGFSALIVLIVAIGVGGSRGRSTWSDSFA